jgi:hypothetical protein
MIVNLEKELDETLQLCKSICPGPWYLFLYYGQLAIANFKGYLHWPEGPKRMIAVIEHAEYLKGISKSRKELFLRRIIAYSKIYKRKAG